MDQCSWQRLTVTKFWVNVRCAESISLTSHMTSIPRTHTSWFWSKNAVKVFESVLALTNRSHHCATTQTFDSDNRKWLVRSWKTYRERNKKKELGSDFKRSKKKCSVRIHFRREEELGTNRLSKWGQNICNCSVKSSSGAKYLQKHSNTQRNLSINGLLYVELGWARATIRLCWAN